MAGTPTGMFAWLKVVTSMVSAEPSCAPYDGPQAARLLAFSVSLALSGKATTGAECWLSPATLASVPRRTAYRYLGHLIDAELVEQTQMPARGRAGRPGRVARYRLTTPENVCHDHAQPWHTKATTPVAHVRAQAVDDADPALSTNVCHDHAQPWRGTTKSDTSALDEVVA